MKALHRSPWLPMAALAVVLAMALGIVLVLLYGRAGGDTEAGYYANVTRLRQLLQYDAQWDVDVFKSRVGLNASYDPLTASLADLDALLASFAAAMEDPGHDDPAARTADASALRSLFRAKSALLERFKSTDSVLRNSLAFLPTAAADAAQALAGHDAKAARDVDALLLDTLIYSQSPADDRRLEIERALQRLDPARARPGGDAGERLAILQAHVETVVREQQAIDTLLADIGRLPIAQRIEAITTALAEEQQRSASQRQRYRGYLLAYGALLTVLLIGSAVRLLRNHALIRDSRDQLLEHGRSLEAKVADRVAALRESEERMTRLAQYDALTGLPNRHLFGLRLAAAMARADREQRHLALMFVDLDHFKQINDSLGHGVGDEVLTAVGDRLRMSLREVDTIARIGGDEFTIILEGLARPGDADAVATHVQQALHQPLVVGGRGFVVSASIGIAAYAFGSGDGGALLQAADIAMYRAKEQGPGTHAVFVPEMAAQVQQRAEMEDLLRHALERGEFELHYQPKLELRSGRMVGVEALLRWNSPELGTVSPARFVPLTEASGLIVPIGEWVLRTACVQGRAWLDQGLAPLTIAVNLSPRQLRDPQLVERIGSALRDSALPGELLELELTEGVIMENVEGNIDTLRAIRALGASLAVDDFGTGYSSLAYLARLPLQTLKIDRAFIAAMLDDANTMALVSTIVALAHTLGLEVVAEGVESRDQESTLRALGCDQMQGYFFSRPVVAASVPALVWLAQTEPPRPQPRNSRSIPLAS